MRLKFTLAFLGAPLALVAFVALHPGVESAEPRFRGTATKFTQAGTYSVDPMHTSVGFEIKHMGIANVHGRFNKKSGKVMVDPADITKSSVEFSLEVTSIDTGVEPRDSHLRTADFFDAAKYPSITFKSTSIRKEGDGYVAEGNLTIKEATRKVSIPFKHYGPITDPQGKTRVGMIADSITINRQDYGVAYDQKLPDGTPSVDNDVHIRLSMEATLDK